MQITKAFNPMLITRRRTPPLVNTPTVVVTALAFALVAGSIHRMPFLDQLVEFKISMFCAEIICGLLLIRLAPRRRIAWELFLITATVISFRFMFGAIVANLEFGQSLAISFQESRFGLMLVSAPLAYIFLTKTSESLLKQYVVCYLVILAALDAWVFSYLGIEDVLVLGQRTDSRFLCSIVTPAIAVSSILIRQHQRGERRIGFSIITGAAMLLHTVLVTTSRIEILLVTGVLGLTLCMRWPRIRWFLYLLALVALSGIVATSFIGEDAVAGRDFGLAMRLSFNAFPLGFGLVIDPTAKELLGLPPDFFFSDYGVLLYFIRYGVLGLLFIFMLYRLWLRFLLGTAHIKGMALLAASILVFLTLIPILDYNSLNGAFLLAFMWFAPQMNLQPINFIK